MKLLKIFKNSFTKISKLLRIKDGHLFIKNLDYILKDKLNISDCTPSGILLKRSNTGENEFNGESPKFADNLEYSTNKVNCEEEDLNNDTVTVKDINQLL